MWIESFGGRSLEEQSPSTLFRRLFAPGVQQDEQVTLLDALNHRDLEGEDLADMARMLLDNCRRVDGAPENAIDLCGTGGDCSGTFNISTVAAFVVAGAGFPVVKHGNRSISSKCGSVDCLEELGVTTALQPGDVLSFLEGTGIAFLFAPVFHPLAGAVTEARRALAARGCKTVFNVLGPLVNPAFVSRRSLGVFCEELIMPVAEALKELDNGEFDAVITDIKMPGMDGIELMGLIKKQRPDLPVILITAFFESQADNGSSRTPHADGFLQKPYVIADLGEVMGKVLDSGLIPVPVSRTLSLT